MKIKFEFEVEIPNDPVQLATDVYSSRNISMEMDI